MATTKVVDLINRVSVTLQDRTNVRWPKADLLVYLNDAQRAIVLQRPDAKTKNMPFACAAGTKQTLPADALRLMAITRNMGGRTITQIDPTVLNIQLPDWHQSVQDAGGIQHFVYDPRDPKTFYVYPGANANQQIEAIYSVAPVDIVVADFATDVQVIALDDTYANSIMDYMMYRAYQKDTTYGDIQKASLYLQSFNSALGIKTQIDSALAQSMATRETAR